VLVRGGDIRSGELFSYVDLEARVRRDHPLRPIRIIVNEALSVLEREFAALYSPIGRPWIPPPLGTGTKQCWRSDEWRKRGTKPPKSIALWATRVSAASGLGGSDAMTDDEPSSVRMEEAVRAIRDALGYRDNLEPQRELIPNLPRDDDFFIKRLAAIEERKGNDAHADRLCQSIPLITECIKKMWLAGLTPKDISVLFRQAADELDKAKTDAS
jgi:hypothetical protein